MTGLESGLQVPIGLWKPEDFADGVPVGEVEWPSMRRSSAGR